MWKTLRTACAKLQEVIVAGVHPYSDVYLAKPDRLLVIANNDKRGLYDNVKSRGSVQRGKGYSRSDQYIRSEDDSLLRYKFVRER